MADEIECLTNEAEIISTPTFEAISRINLIKELYCRCLITLF